MTRWQTLDLANDHLFVMVYHARCEQLTMLVATEVGC